MDEMLGKTKRHESPYCTGGAAVTGQRAAMTPKRYAQVSEIYLTVLDERVESRASRLDELCGGDVDLRREVDRLLVRQGGSSAA
jgi:hypothetical protein